MPLSPITQRLSAFLKSCFGDAAAEQPQTRSLSPKEMAALIDTLYTAKEMTQTALIAVDSLLAATPLEDNPDSAALCSEMKCLGGENRDRMIMSIQEYTLNAAALTDIRHKALTRMMNRVNHHNSDETADILADIPLGAAETNLISSVVEGERTARKTYERVAFLTREMVGKVDMPHVKSLIATLDEFDNRIKVRTPIPPFSASVPSPSPGS